MRSASFLMVASSATAFQFQCSTWGRKTARPPIPSPVSYSRQQVSPLCATANSDDESKRSDASSSKNNSTTESDTPVSGSIHTDDEWHPHDPAWTTPQLLVGLWSQIAQGASMTKGETYTVMYPQMENKFAEPRYLNLLFAHLDQCKDVCDHFGISTTLVPYKKKGRVAGFTVKSFRNKSTVDTNEDGEYEFGYDPFWDDGTDFEALYDGIDDEDMAKDPYPAIVNKIPDSDDEIIDLTKGWVSSMMSDMGVCPFTQGAEQAGLPIGNVFYAVDRCTGFEDMYVRYWKEVVRLEQNTEKDVSTTLLIGPEFCLDNIELFDSFTNTLTQPLTALGIEDLLQLVFFHPHWSFRDGDARSGEGQAANYARRSPWPMINLLRTTQVRAAQKGIPTGLVYKQNEKTLARIGVDSLETMLRMRDWSDTAKHKVNRQDVDALKIAREYQATGNLSPEHTSMQHDSTPAANRVASAQVQEGNLVNVVLQALEKRLGKSSGSNGVAPLSGPETSATAMASDVLLQQLDSILDSAEPTSAKQSPPAQSAVRKTNTDTTIATAKVDPKVADRMAPRTAIKSANVDDTVDDDVPEEIRQARQERIDAARRAVLDDISTEQQETRGGAATGRGDPLQEALFGKGGVGDRSLDDEMFPEGMNPDSFY